MKGLGVLQAPMTYEILATTSRYHYRYIDT